MATKWTPTVKPSIQANVKSMEKSVQITPKTVTPTKFTPSVSPSFQQQQSNNQVVNLGGGGSFTPTVRKEFVPTAVPTTIDSVSPSSKALLSPAAKVTPTVEGVDVSGMAISAQKQLKTPTGGSKTITKLGENSYTVVEKDSSGHLIRSVNVNPGHTVSTLGQSSGKETDIKLKVLATPGSEKIISKIDAADPSAGDSIGQQSSTKTPPPSSTEEDETPSSWLSTAYDRYVPDTVKGAVSVVADPVGSGLSSIKETIAESLKPIDSAINEYGGSSSAVEKVSVVSSPSPEPVTAAPDIAAPREVVSVAPVSDAPVTSDVPLLDAVTSGLLNTEYTLDLEGGNIYPVTDEEKGKAARDYLDDHYPDQAGSGQNNELVCKYAWFLVPQMSQNGVDYYAVADAFRDYESLFNGDVVTAIKYGENVPSEAFQSNRWNGIASLQADEQKQLLIQFAQDQLDNGVPPVVVTMMVYGLSEACGGKKTTIQSWISNGGFAEDMNSDVVWMQSTSAKDWVSSPTGMSAIGASMGLIGTIGAFMATGPVGAAATFGTLTFNVTEFVGNFGTAAWKTKGELQLTGEYAQDHVSSINSLFSASNSAISNIGFAKSTNDPSVNLQNIANAEASLEALQKSIYDNWAYLEAANVYDDKVRQVQIQERALETNKGMFDAQGNYIAKDNPPVEVRVINTDKGWTITYGELKLRADGHGTLGEITDNFIGDVVITDSSGNEIGRQQLKTQLFSGDQVIDAASIVSQSQKYKGKEETANTEYVRTIYLQPGQSMEYNGKIYTATDRVIPYDITLHEGIPTRIKFSQDGKESKVEYFGAQGVAWGTYTPVLEDAFTKAPETAVNQGFKLITSPDSVVKINGRVFSAQGEKNVVPVAPGYYSVEVETPGKETWQKTVYIGEGQYMSISDASQDVEEPWSSDYSSGGGSSGGGSSSGGSSSSSSEALIIYGETCRNARIWQDDVEVSPEIGKTYSISPGYHGIKISKTGKKDWIKTVYCMAGDSVTVSPALEDSTDTNGTDTNGTDTNGNDSTVTKTTKRVYFNSEPLSARVMINGGFSGEWTPCFLDLEPGYYKVQILKTGYKAQDHTLYVGSVIAWDLYADQLAKQEGIYYV